MPFMTAPLTSSMPEGDAMKMPTEPVVVALEEKGGEESARQENLKYSSLVQHVHDKFRKSRDQRQVDEQRWQQCYHNFRGFFGDDFAFTDREKSKAFIKITKTKVNAAYSQIIDVLFSGNKFPIGIEPRKVPTGIADKVHIDPKAPPQQEGAPSMGPTVSRPGVMQLTGKLKASLEPVAEHLKEGQGMGPGTATWEPNKDAAKAMEKLIHDQLEEADTSKKLRKTVFEMSLLGTGIFKGPFITEKEYPRWTEDGEYAPEIMNIPDVESVSVWDIYPDNDARSPEEAEWIIQRHRMSRTDLHKLKKRPHFREDSIDIALAEGPHYTEQWWEHLLDDNEGESPTSRYEILEYWGNLDAEMAEEAGLELPKEYKDTDFVQVNVWVCNGQILRLVFNPFKPQRIPYFIIPFELNPYSLFGIGVAENMIDTQNIMNGFVRLAVDNAVLSSNIIFEIDETNMVPGQDMDLYPGKMFRRQGGAPGQAIHSHKIQNVTNECLMMFDKARQLSDEATGIPSYAHGMSGIQNVNRTASGMSMLMGASDRNNKTVIKNIDDYFLRPFGKDCFALNMQYNFDHMNVQGDYEVIARGTESLMQNEVRSQKLLQFLQITANPLDAPFTRRDYALRELAKSLDLDAEALINDPREAAKMAVMYQKMGGMPPAGGGPQQAQAPQGAPAPSDPTGNGGANINPGEIRPPGTEGFTDPTGGMNAA